MDESNNNMHDVKTSRSKSMGLPTLFAALAMLFAAGATVAVLTQDVTDVELNNKVDKALTQLNDLQESNIERVNEAVDTDGYQAVFLNDGTIYFGKLSDGEPGQWRLEDIYYLQVDGGEATNVQSTSQLEELDSTQISLAKLGSELHGPEDVMHIIPANVLFWENLKSDSQVVTAIRDFQGGR